MKNKRLKIYKIIAEMPGICRAMWYVKTHNIIEATEKGQKLIDLKNRDLGWCSRHYVMENVYCVEDV